MSDRFGDKLRNRRIEMGFTLEGLAEKVGTTKAYVWQLENKKPAKPTGDLLIKLAKTLEISAEFLIDDQRDEPSSSQVQVALARGADSRGLSQRDIDKLFKIADIRSSDKSN